MQSTAPATRYINANNVTQSTAQAVADARKAADYMNAAAPGSPAAQQATRTYLETKRLAARANATHDPNIARQAVQASQASVNHTNNVAIGRSPNTYTPYNSNGNATSYFNSSYQTGKTPSPGAPRIEELNEQLAYYCSIADRVPNINAFGAGDYGGISASIHLTIDWFNKADQAITSFIGGAFAGVLQSTAEGALFVEGVLESWATGQTINTTRHISAVRNFFEQGKNSSENPTAYQAGKVIGDVALIGAGVYGAIKAAPVIAEIIASAAAALGIVGAAGDGAIVVSSAAMAQLESVITASLASAAATAGGSTLGNDIQELEDDIQNEEISNQISAGDKTERGREYTRHAAERANERGFDSKKIDSIIDNNYKHRVKEIDSLTGEVTWRYQDVRGNTVITNEWGDKIVTVYSYPQSVNGGNYIPKG